MRLTWSVADGSRGRRWRAVSTADGAITHALLLEVDLAGRPARLELTTPAGMLTLHPSADQRELHGNVVGLAGEGVRPLALGWDSERELDVVDRPLAIAVGLRRRRPSVPVGQAIDIDVVAIGPGLEFTTIVRQVERLEDGLWRIRGTGGAADRRISLTPDGLPAGGTRWALETD